MLLAFGLVGVVLGGLFLYSGAWPPMVIIESGSMMHPESAVPYGRFGTIDPGDIVVVRAFRSAEDVETWAEGGGLRYGKSGDVIIYRPYNNSRTTPVIHRAMAWVDVEDDFATGERAYRVHWVEGRVLEFGSEGIYLPELGFDEAVGFTPENGYKPGKSGFITKGDNPLTNARADQASAERATRLSDLVQPDWIVGVSRGELPWFGLVKLVFGSTFNQASPPPTWIRVGNAYAPYDLWTMLGFCIVLIVLAPLTFDVVVTWRDRRAARRALALAEKRARGEIAPDDEAAVEFTPDPDPRG